MIRNLKIRLLPTREQEKALWLHVHAARFVYNYMIDEHKRSYEMGTKIPTAYDMNYLLTPLKRQCGFEWLQDVSAQTLYHVNADVEHAYTMFFQKKARYPRYKSRKRSKVSFPLCDAIGKVWFTESVVNIPRVGKVRYQTNYDIPTGRHVKFYSPRIIQQVNGKWILNIGIEREIQAHTLTDASMGIDLGVKETAVIAFGDQQIVYPNINKTHKVMRLEKRLRHIQRNISRKYRQNGSYDKTRNILKEEHKMRIAMRHLANIRQDFRHKMTREIVNMNPSHITMEGLNVEHMWANRYLAKRVKDQAFAEIIRQVCYKCEESGVPFYQVDRFYPSSKRCSRCGFVKSKLSLSVREYHCEECGLIIDRDYNAAINLRNYTVN